MAWYTARLYRATVQLGKDVKATGTQQAKDTEAALSIAKKAAEAASKSANAAELTVETMQALARHQLRAYFGINAAYLEDTIGPGKPVTVTFQLKNFGQTPAYETTGSANLALLSARGSARDSL